MTHHSMIHGLGIGRGWVIGVIAATLLTTAAMADDGVTILPRRIMLNGPAARQTVIVQQFRGHLLLDPVHDGYELQSSDESVVRIERDRALPVSDGTATIRVKVGDHVATADVTVSGMDQPFEWSFRNHVQPVLAKFGCSSGACHGAAAGKNGFRLSLRGYDDEGDWRSLTRHAGGRRVVPADPAASLLLRKPTGAIKHKGGVKFSPQSLEYRVLSEWIADGAAPPRPDEARIDRIEIVPPRVVVKPGAEQQLIVMAHFTDGTVQDVTRWAKYTAGDTSVATIDERTGRATVVGHGEGPITAWYLSRIATATIAVPYENDVPNDVFAASPRRNYIDELVLEKLQALRLPPSGAADDATFLRRAFLDTIGRQPSVEEAKAFLADTSVDKRDRLIESLLGREQFVDYWAYRWSDLLLVNSAKLRPPAMWAYYRWIRDHVAANTPWDELARRLVTARGGTLENGAANFYLLHDDPAEMAETVTITFLGMSINCAKCHNHPLEKWTNGQYYGMANLFSRVRTKNADGDGHHVVFSASEGELVQPLTGKPQPPTPLDGEPIAFDDPADRREHAAAWLTSPDNPYFARAVVNRVWANFMGVGLVENIDDMRQTNPPSNEKLLDALARDLIDNGYDLKALMRRILQSHTYQRSSEPTAANAGDRRFYSRYYPRRLMAEVMLDALSDATGAPTAFNGYPAGWRAVQLPDSNVNSYFLSAFGRPERVITCACERTDEPSMTQVLHIANGDTINQKLAAKGNRIDALLEAKASLDAIVEQVYLAALSRYPTEAERARLVAALGDVPDADRRAAVEDLFWSVLSSKQFLFNH